jgi:hypothetical protein
VSADVPLPDTDKRADGRPTDGSPTEGPEFGDLLSGLDDLAHRPLTEHHDRLAQVHEALHATLHQSPTTPASGSSS